MENPLVLKNSEMVIVYFYDRKNSHCSYWYNFFLLSLELVQKNHLATGKNGNYSPTRQFDKRVDSIFIQIQMRWVVVSLDRDAQFYSQTGEGARKRGGGRCTADDGSQ